MNTKVLLQLERKVKECKEKQLPELNAIGFKFQQFSNRRLGNVFAEFICKPIF